MGRKRKIKRDKEIKVGTLGEDLETSKPVVVDLEPLESIEADSEPAPVPKKAEKPKEQPGTWPFTKANVANEQQELNHIHRLINMKHNNPGAKTITKVVVLDCKTQKVICEDYKIEY